ncbi:MAG: T9SS type A sorting domain-containing protein [Bacteroidetes bacterium]|nr:T9SS type A sorting domain-containing protein [Bacteroidota bacterium]
MKKFLLLLAIVLLFSVKGYSQYFTEDFESAFVGSPPAPAGWTQTSYNINTTAASDKDWVQNTWTGAAWSVTSNGTNPTGAKSGTGVLWIDDYNYVGASNPQNSSRMESGAINILGATSPYLRFWYFNNQAPGQTMNFRVMLSSNSGATWDAVPILNGWDSAANKWNRINIPIPAAYRTSTFRLAFEITNRWGTNNPFIDLVSVEEYTPTTITSTGAGGNWNDPAAWVGGVPPTSDNNINIVTGATITVPAVVGLIARCQNAQIDGTLTFGTTTSTAFCAFGNITVGATGRLNAFNGTSGRSVLCGGNFTNGGAINFAIPNATANNWSVAGLATGAATLVLFGPSASNYDVTGTLDSGRINNVWVIKSGAGGAYFNTALTVPLTFGAYSGNSFGSLTLGNAGANGTTQTIERSEGSFPIPTFNNTRITARNYNYLTTNMVPLIRAIRNFGSEVETVLGVRTITGTLRMDTYNRWNLSYPLTVGTATTGGLTLTKGIITTDATNIISFTSFVAPPAGIAPTTIFPTTNTVQGSYIVGPVKIDFPTSTASRNVPIGTGTNSGDGVVSTNRLLGFSLATITAWTAGTSITVTPVGKPSGTANAPLSSVIGTRAYQISLNAGSPDLSVDAYISALRANNYVNGGGASSDSIGVNQQNLFIAQSTALTGPWNVRSLTSGTGALVNNTDYTRNTASGAPGPIAPIAANGGFFAWATNSVANDVQANTIIPSGSSFLASLSSPISMTGTVKNAGLAATTSTIYVTRTVVGTAYSSSTTIPSGLGAGATSNTTFADFNGWTSGVTYQIKDSVYYAGDGVATNDTLSAFFTPSAAKPVLIYYGTDTRSRDSIVAHMNNLGLSTKYDLVASFPAGTPLSLWRTIVFLSISAYNLNTNTAVRDSLKLWLDGSTPSAKRSLVLFGNDIGYNADPRRGGSPTPADTVFYRQYLHAAFWSDDWVDNFVASDSTLKGTGSAPWSTITAQRINDPYPDCIQPAIWNNTGGTPYAALFPVTESGDGDSCGAVAYNGTNYNTFYMSNVYSSISPTVSGALSPQGVVLNVIKTYVEGVDGVFPVELASFTSSIDKRNVTLKWSTNNEENNAGFDIERRVSGTSEWNKVGNVAGAGNSNSIKNYSFDDRNLASARYQYRLKQMDFNGNYKYYELGNEVIIGVPSRFDISQNYPNPFNPSTKINFDLPFDSKVQIKVFDMTGREISQIVNEAKTAGYYTVNFNASALASGVYFYQINATGGSQSFVKTMKMVLVK